MRTVFRNSEIPGRIHALQPFLSVGKLPDGTRVWSGHSGPAASLGHLPRKYHSSARSAVYVVYSYATPVAWVLEAPQNGPQNPYWFKIPDVSYSLTTGQHQYACMEAWADEMKRQGRYRRGPGRGREVVSLPATAEAYGTPRHLRSGGIDGVRPGDVIDGREARLSAYAAMGDDASHWSPLDQGGLNMRDKVDRPGYTHPAHP